jgi:hypothetical protein
MLVGSSAGLIPAPESCRFWHQNRPQVHDTAEYADYFGYSLAAGDFDGDSFDDLAVGVPNEDLGFIGNAGAVHVISCSPFGVFPQFWHQDVANVEDTSEASDEFGYSLTAARFNGDAYADVAIGVPFEDLSTASGNTTDAGAVSVLYGSSQLLSATAIPDQLWTQTVVLPPMLR